MARRDVKLVAMPTRALRLACGTEVSCPPSPEQVQPWGVPAPPSKRDVEFLRIGGNDGS
jgi:hypothetical protein